MDDILAQNQKDVQRGLQSISINQLFGSSTDGAQKQAANSQESNDTIPKDVADRTRSDSKHQSLDGTDGQEANGEYEEDEEDKAWARQIRKKIAIKTRMQWLLTNRLHLSESVNCRYPRCNKKMKKHGRAQSSDAQSSINTAAIEHASSHCIKRLHVCLACRQVKKEYSCASYSNIRQHVSDKHETKPVQCENWTENWSTELYRALDECYNVEETGDSSVVSSNDGAASGCCSDEALDTESSAIETDDQRASVEAPAIVEADDKLAVALAQVRDELAKTKAEFDRSQEDRDQLRVELETMRVDNSRLDVALMKSEGQVRDAQYEFATTKTELARSQENRDQLRVELARSEEALMKSQAEREKAETERDELNEQLRETKAQSLEERRRLEEELNEEKAKVEDLEDEISNKMATISRVAKALAKSAE